MFSITYFIDFRKLDIRQFVRSSFSSFDCLFVRPSVLPCVHPFVRSSSSLKQRKTSFHRTSWFIKTSLDTYSSCIYLYSLMYHQHSKGSTDAKKDRWNFGQVFLFHSVRTYKLAVSTRKGKIYRTDLFKRVRDSDVVLVKVVGVGVYEWTFLKNQLRWKIELILN